MLVTYKDQEWELIRREPDGVYAYIKLPGKKGRPRKVLATEITWPEETQLELPVVEVEVEPVLETLDDETAEQLAVNTEDEKETEVESA